LERRATEIIEHIYDKYGGVLPATNAGYFRRAISDSSHRFGAEFDRGERVMIGVNKYAEHDYERIPLLKIDRGVEREQVGRLKELKQRRDSQRHRVVLARLREAALDGENLMPYLIDAAEAYATVGEMMDTLKGVYGLFDGGPEF